MQQNYKVYKKCDEKIEIKTYDCNVKKRNILQKFQDFFFKENIVSFNVTKTKKAIFLIKQKQTKKTGLQYNFKMSANFLSYIFQY